MLYQFPNLLRGTLPLLVLFLIGTVDAAVIRGRIDLKGKANRDAVANRVVVLYETTEGRPVAHGAAVTQRSGQFWIQTDRRSANGIFYVTTQLPHNVRLVTVLGPTLPNRVTLNELTSVAASYSMAQFFKTNAIAGDPFALRIAAMMSENIANPTSGKISDVLKQSPNADETESLRLTRSLANIVNLCARNSKASEKFRRMTRVTGESSPNHTAQAMANLARDPARKARRIFQLSEERSAFSPVLRTAPDGWCVTVKVNQTGDPSVLFGGPANVAFDARGYAWIPNNSVQGTPDSSEYLMVLRPDGKPAGGENGGPVSPKRGGGILGGGWGVTLDSRQRVWTSNFGWGGLAN